MCIRDRSKLGMEARDNVKFLTTLERHFKAISHEPLEGALINTSFYIGTAAPLRGISGCCLMKADNRSDDQI